MQYYWTGAQPVTLSFFNGSSVIVNVSGGVVSYLTTIDIAAKRFVAGEVIVTPQVGFEPVSVTNAYVAQTMSNTVHLGQMNLTWNGSAFVVASDWTETRLVTKLYSLTLNYTCNQQPPSMTGDEVVTYKMLKQLI